MHDLPTSGNALISPFREGFIFGIYTLHTKAKRSALSQPSIFDYLCITKKQNDVKEQQQNSSPIVVCLI